MTTFLAKFLLLQYYRQLAPLGVTGDAGRRADQERPETPEVTSTSGEVGEIDKNVEKAEEDAGESFEEGFGITS